MINEPLKNDGLFSYLDEITKEIVLKRPWKDFLAWQELPLIKLADEQHGQQFWDDLSICYLGSKPIPGLEFPDNRDYFLRTVQQNTLPPVLITPVSNPDVLHERQRELILYYQNKDDQIRSEIFTWDVAFANFDAYQNACGAIGAYDTVVAAQTFLQNFPGVDVKVRDFVAKKACEYLHAFKETFFTPKSVLSFAAAGWTLEDLKEIEIDFHRHQGTLALVEFVKPLFQDFLSKMSEPARKALVDKKEKENFEPKVLVLHS